MFTKRWMVVLALLVCVAGHAQPKPADPAAHTAARMLAATGGAEAWKRVTGMVNVATQRAASQPKPYQNTIWNDFLQMRFRTHARNDTLDRGFAIDGERGTALREGEFRVFDTARVKEEQQFWRSNVYRTLMRLANADAALTLKLNTDGRLEVWEDGARLNWFRLNVAGEPVQFGTGANETGTVFGPWVDGPAGIRHPKWGSNADGTWQYEIIRIELNPTFPSGWFEFQPPR